MKSGLPILQPNSKSPFDGDLLSREQVANVLHSIVNAFSSGCVISVNGKWGTGKSTFLSMWEAYMQKNDYNIIHFNAWENDNISDPLLAIIAEFEQIKGENTQTWNNLVENCSRLTLSILPSIIAAFLEHKTGLNIKELVEKGLDESVNIIKQSISSYKEQKNTIKAFKESLLQYVNQCRSKSNKPVLFVIDELDRCNPTFAVKTLERIKHLFEIDNVVYIIAIDEQQLCHSIRGFFGSEQFDARDYLRRFIKFQYDLPQGPIANVIDNLMGEFDFASIANSGMTNTSLDDIKIFTKFLCIGTTCSIRQIERYLLYSKIALSTFRGLTIDPLFAIFLVYLKLFDRDFFSEYVEYKIDEQEIINHFESHYNEGFFDSHTPSVLYGFYQCVADLLKIRYPRDFHEEKIISSQGELRFQIKRFDEEQFSRCLQLSKYYPNFNIVHERLNFTSNINI